jgi:hypothetical protein
MFVLSNLPCIHVISPTVLSIGPPFHVSGDEELPVVMSIENVAIVFQVF